MPLTTSEPADLPEWDPADPADVIDPGAGVKAAGWQANDPAVHTTFNWWWQLVYFWIEYLQDVVNNVLGTEHTITGANGGKHTTVNADRYKYRAARTVRVNLGNPAQGGGWRVVAGGFESLVNSTGAAYVTPALNSADTYWTIPLDMFLHRDGDSAGDQYTIAALTLDYHSSAANDKCEFVIGSYQTPNDGSTPSETTEASGTATDGTTTRGSQTFSSLGIAVSAGRSYYLRVLLRGHTNAADAALFGAWLTVERSYLE